MAHTVNWIEVATLASGLPLRVAVHDVSGDNPGPTIGITAAIHGDELAPVEALRRLVGTLDPAQLRGRLLIAPVVNPLAFQSQTRHTPQDMQNLNRVFPGDPNGWLTEQLAAAFVRDFMPRIDVLLDLHAGGALPTVDYAYIDNDEALSRAFNTRVLYRGPGFHGTLSAVAVERGLPCVVTELGGGLLRDEDYIGQTVDGLMNVLQHLKVLPGEPQQRDRPDRHRRPQHDPRPPRRPARARRRRRPAGRDLPGRQVARPHLQPADLRAARNDRRPTRTNAADPLPRGRHTRGSGGLCVHGGAGVSGGITSPPGPLSREERGSRNDEVSRSRAHSPSPRGRGGRG